MRIEKPTFGFSIVDGDGNTVYGSNTEIDGAAIPFIEGNGSLVLEIDASSLHAGNYMISFSLHSQNHAINYHRLENHLPVVLGTNTGFDGICRLPSRWS